MPINPIMLQKFLDMSVSRDPDYANLHNAIVQNTETKKPRNWVEFDKLDEERAKEALTLKKKYQKDIEKSRGDYKDLVEECYMRLISNKAYNPDGLKDKELEMMQLKAMIFSSVIMCKAGDCVRVELGVNEAQLNEAVQRFKLEGDASNVDSKKE